MNAYCKNCKEHASFYQEDLGIGAYEFWGSKGVHHDYAWICSECEDVYDGDHSDNFVDRESILDMQREDELSMIYQSDT